MAMAHLARQIREKLVLRKHELHCEANNPATDAKLMRNFYGESYYLEHEATY